MCPLVDPSTLSEDKLIGTTIDNRYTVEGRLGEGGMGVVYQARHVTLRKPVAIKVLRKAQEESAWKRFIQEAQTASMINHTNVVALTDFGLIEGHPYLVMEFLDGETLTEAITSGPIAPLRVCRIGAQIAKGLQAVHDKGIVHRDHSKTSTVCCHLVHDAIQEHRSRPNAQRCVPMNNVTSQPPTFRALGGRSVRTKGSAAYPQSGQRSGVTEAAAQPPQTPETGRPGSDPATPDC